MGRKIFNIFFLLVFLLGAFCVYFILSGKSPLPQFADDKALEFSDQNLKSIQKIGFEGAQDLDSWKSHSFQGESRSEIKAEENVHLLDVQSEGTSSLLLKEANVSVESRPHLSWEWKVIKFPMGKSNQEFGVSKDSDYGARVYAIFKGLTPFTSDTIQYIWDDHFKAGTYRTSPFANHIKLLVVESGPPGEKWVKETRDIVKDYEMLFGRKPKTPLHAVGIMSDSDNTRTSSHAQFKNIEISIPQGMTSETVNHNPMHSAVYSLSEHFLFLNKANEAGVSAIKQGSSNFFGALTKFRDNIRDRLSFPRKS